MTATNRLLPTLLRSYQNVFNSGDYSFQAYKNGYKSVIHGINTPNSISRLFI
jgi:hypothetical protein